MRAPEARPGAAARSAQQDEDHTRPKSMWERVTSRGFACMAQVEQVSVFTSTCPGATAHSMDRVDSGPCRGRSLGADRAEGLGPVVFPVKVFPCSIPASTEPSHGPVRHPPSASGRRSRRPGTLRRRALCRPRPARRAGCPRFRHPRRLLRPSRTRRARRDVPGRAPYRTDRTGADRDHHAHRAVPGVRRCGDPRLDQPRQGRLVGRCLGHRGRGRPLRRTARSPERRTVAPGGRHRRARRRAVGEPGPEAAAGASRHRRRPHRGGRAPYRGPVRRRRPRTRHLAREGRGDTQRHPPARRGPTAGTPARSASCSRSSSTSARASRRRVWTPVRGSRPRARTTAAVRSTSPS